jgi:hypothetical protein
MKDSIIKNFEETEENDNFLELKGDNLCLIDNTVKVSQGRYNELIKARTTLEILGRVIKQTKPYDIDTYRAIAGKYIPSDEEENKK